MKMYVAATAGEYDVPLYVLYDIDATELRTALALYDQGKGSLPGLSSIEVYYAMEAGTETFPKPFDETCTEDWLPASDEVVQAFTQSEDQVRSRAETVHVDKYGVYFSFYEKYSGTHYITPLLPWSSI